VEIVFQSHHANVTDRLRLAARRGLEKLASRLTRPVGAVVRFEEDGRLRRVEVVLQARGRQLIAEAEGRYYGPALSQALAHLESRLRRVRRPVAQRARRAARS
jgi:ribosome-associated translation inhibitor RaiA